MIGSTYKDVTDNPAKRLSDSPLSKLISDSPAQTEKNYDSSLAKSMDSESLRIGLPILNKQEGLHRERVFGGELVKKYPITKGYSIYPERYLRDINGCIAKDPLTGEARRIDYVVVKGNTVCDSIEVTSKTADKIKQTAKEDRIRNSGGNFIKDDNNHLVEFPLSVRTRIERL